MTPIWAVTAMNSPANSSRPLPKSNTALTAGRTTTVGATPEGPGVREVLTARARAARANDSRTNPIAATATPGWSRSSLARPPVAPPIAARAAMKAGIRARASCASRLRTTVGSSEGAESGVGGSGDDGGGTGSDTCTSHRVTELRGALRLRLHTARWNGSYDTVAPGTTGDVRSRRLTLHGR